MTWSPPESDFAAASNWAPPESDFDAATTAPAPTKTYDPTEGMSIGDKFTAGVGKAFVDTGRGIYQLGASIGHAAGMVSDEKMAQIQQDVDEAKELDKPLMATTSGRVGNIVGQAAPALALPGAGIIGSAIEGAGMGALQPVATGESRAQNIGMGGVGGAAGAVLGKLVSGVAGGFRGAGAREEAVNLLREEGIPVSVGQATKAKLAQTVERASAMTGDEAAEFAANQASAFNRAVLRRVGVDDPFLRRIGVDPNGVVAATPEVLGPARQAITNVMDGVASRTRPHLDNALLNDMAQIEQDAARQLPASDIAPITQNLNDILENATQNNGYLNGTFVRKLNSNLGALSRNPSTAPIASDLQEAVHNAVQRYASPGDAAALAQAQGRFRALKQIEPAVEPATGNISVPKLLNSMNTKAYGGRNQVLYGRGDQDLANLARAAKQVIPENLGNSGTAERALPALTALEVAASGEPVKAGLKAAAGVAGLNAAGRAMRSQGVVGRYLINGIPGVRALAPALERAGMPVGYGVAQSQPRDRDSEITRATGGKVDEAALVERLMQRWKAAKKMNDAGTETLLKAPDASIIKALDIAGRYS